MKQIALTLVAAFVLAGCVSGNNSISQEPNYVQSQIYQSPMPAGNDNFGTDNLPPVVGRPR